MNAFNVEANDVEKLKNEKFSREDFVNWYRMYARKHRTTGCRITHLIGVPTLILSVPALIKRPPLGFLLIAVGYSFQMIGHYVFEKNQPVLLETKDLRVIPVAFAFVARDWHRVLTGRFTNRDLHARKLR